MSEAPEHILVVEDDDWLQLTVSNVLDHHGFRVTRVASAEKALEVLRDDASVTLVFTDINLAGRSTGVDLYRRIQRDWPQLPVVLTSGTPFSRPQAEAPDDTPAFLPKPYRVKELLDSIGTALEGNRSA